MVDEAFGANGAANARLTQWAAEAKAKAERYQAMRTQAQQVSVSASSPGGLVTVTVDSGGNVTELRVTDRVRELTGERIGSLVLTTIRQAQAKLPERLREIMADTIGTDQRTIDTIVGNYQARFPQPPEDQPAPPEWSATQLDIGRADADSPEPTPPAPAPARIARRPRPPSGGDDGEDYDWGGQPILRRS